MAQLAITVDRHPGFSLVGLDGQLDQQTRPGLQEIFEGLLGEPVPRIVVDASELTFCDSHGLSALISSQRRAEVNGGGLRLIGVQGTLARLLIITQLVDLFPPYTSLSHAARWPRPL